MKSLDRMIALQEFLRLTSHDTFREESSEFVERIRDWHQRTFYGGSLPEPDWVEVDGAEHKVSGLDTVEQFLHETDACELPITMESVNDARSHTARYMERLEANQRCMELKRFVLHYLLPELLIHMRRDTSCDLCQGYLQYYVADNGHLLLTCDMSGHVFPMDGNVFGEEQLDVTGPPPDRPAYKSELVAAGLFP